MSLCHNQQLHMCTLFYLSMLPMLFDNCIKCFVRVCCRVMIIFLKRYGYNTNLSRNPKRIDFIRIPRFIAVGVFSGIQCVLL